MLSYKLYGIIKIVNILSETTSLAHFKRLLDQQIDRVHALKNTVNPIDFSKKTAIRVGICMGDGIGDIITEQAQRVLEAALIHERATKRVTLVPIHGLTIANRLRQGVAIPSDVLDALKACDVILKGPTTTPQKGDGGPNIESANVAMRRELDLFACVRPIQVPQKGIDWVFFRENTEGEYMLGSSGIDMAELSIDFKVTSDIGSERIIRMAFEHAKATHRKRVTVVTKSNVIKATDGRFSEVARRIATEYTPFGIHCDEWYVDIMAAKLIDPQRQADFEVIVLPNLYGDILTDQAGQIQGGLGTAGSANIGTQYAMFEAVHGSAPRMVTDGRAHYANPSSMIKAAAMLLQHIGYTASAAAIDQALLRAASEPSVAITGRPDGATASELTDWIIHQTQLN